MKWKTEIPLLGLSSPVVMDDRIWLTTATVEGHDYYVICVDAKTGEILDKKKLFHSDNPQSMGNGSRDNSYGHAIGGCRARTGLCSLRSLWNGLSRRLNQGGPLETGRSEMLALQWARPPLPCCSKISSS